MKVHHLNCCTMCPPAVSAWLNGQGHLVAHVLLIESEQGLILVDTGVGVRAIEDRQRMLTSTFVRLVGPRLAREETALVQLEALGHKADDVRHIVLTHLDVDHAGGLADFPHATVHVLADEHAAATHPRTLFERQRYRPAQWEHEPTWALHAPGGEGWHGFECVRDIPGLPPEILLVPLPGHTRGHAAVAVDAGVHWLLHCGDAYFFHGEVEDPPRSTPLLTAFQRIVAVDWAQRTRNLARVRELVRHDVGVKVMSAHCPVDLERARALEPARPRTVDEPPPPRFGADE